MKGRSVKKRERVVYFDLTPQEERALYAAQSRLNDAAGVLAVCIERLLAEGLGSASWQSCAMQALRAWDKRHMRLLALYAPACDRAIRKESL